MAPLTHITGAQLRALERLALILPSDAYLAGGVAATAILDHRPSHDLDVFMRTSDPVAFLHPAAQLERTRILSRARGTLELEVEGVPLSVLAFPYPDLSQPISRAPIAIPCASAADLTAMKVSAIAGRGAAKDFWDLHALLQHRNVALAGAIEELEKKFAAQDPGSVIRSLAYFGDADAEPLPRGLSPAAWAAIKADFRRWVSALE